MQSFVVPGHPVPHVRMTQASKHTSEQAGRYLAYKDEVGLRANMAGVVPIEGPVAIEIHAFVRERRWDASNVLKAIEDGLNGIGYADDWQIIDAHVRVFAGIEDECVVVSLRAIEGESQPCPTSSAPSRESSQTPSIGYPRGSISAASRSSGSKTAG